jgi:hypothetical protein
MTVSTDEQLDILTRSVYALLQWAEANPMTQWADMGTMSALRLELEDVIQALQPQREAVAPGGAVQSKAAP